MAEKKTAEKQPVVEEPAAETEEKRNELLHNIWLVGLGTVAAAEDGAVKLYRYLRDKGEQFENDHKDSFDDFRTKARETGRDVKERVGKGWSEMGEKVDDKVSSALSKVGVTGRELGALKKRVDDLSAKVDELKPEAAN